MSKSSTKTVSRGNKILIFLGIIAFVLGSFRVVRGTDFYNDVRYLSGTGGVLHILGSFFQDDGNPGEIQFGATPTDGFSGAHLYIPTGTGAPFLTGNFWMQTVGWTSFHEVTLNSQGNNVWSLSGYGWSDNAGWMDFSGVTYHLASTSFSGYAWNDGIGWVDMFDAIMELTSLSAVGKVKILGSLGGNSSYNTTYNINDGAITSVSTTNIINTIRKNVALITRNIPATKRNTSVGVDNTFNNGDADTMPLQDINNMLLFEYTGSLNTRVEYSRSMQSRVVNIGNVYNPVYSIIAIGTDIYIDESVLPQSDDRARVFIALKNEAGVGGNIYIDGINPKKIKASLIAEGSLYSGEFVGASPIYYNDDPADMFRIPNKQLYIHGSVISNNTIGGYGLSNGLENKCPYNITPCSDSNALKYDFNHFRDFQEDDAESIKTTLRGYEHPTDAALDNIYDAYSMVIEHDTRILSNPPPGLAQQ